MRPPRSPPPISPRSTPGSPPPTTCCAPRTRATTGRASPCTPCTCPPTGSRPSCPTVWRRTARDAVDDAGGLDAGASLVGLDATLAAERRAARAREARARTDRRPAHRLRRRLRRPRRRRPRTPRRCAPPSASPPPSAPGSLRRSSASGSSRSRPRPGPAASGPSISSSPRSWSSGGLPDGLALTLPKVSTVAQVEAMAEVVAGARTGARPAGRAAAVRGAGRDAAARARRLRHRRPSRSSPLAVPGRISGLHYGTYDYSAALGIAAQYQSHGAPGGRPREGHHAARGRRHRHPALRRVDATSCPSATHRRGVAAARAARAPVARARVLPGLGPAPATSSSRRYLATYAFYREGWPEASGTPARLPAAEPPARCSTNRPRCARSPDSCCAACAAAPSRPTRSPTPTGIGLSADPCAPRSHTRARVTQEAT